MSIYSDVLGSALAAASTAVTLFTVPASERWVLKELSVCCGTTAATTTYAYRAGNSVRIYSLASLGVESSVVTPRTCTFEGGDGLVVFSTGAATFWDASGYKFTTP